MAEPDEAIRCVLHEVRRHLGLDIAFVSQVNDVERVIRYVDTELVTSPLQPGHADPVDESYCRYVLSGEIPQLLHDAGEHPVTARLTATTQLPVGTHLSMPIVLSDGTVYGTFCCFSHQVVESVVGEHLTALRLAVDIVTGYLERLETARREHREQRRRLQALKVGTDLLTAYQPIVRLTDGEVVGMEALARFPTLDLGPGPLFAQAWEVGLGVETEMKAVESALAQLHRLPPGAYLSINAAPTTLASEQFLQAVRRSSPGRIVAEVTEHAAVEDLDELRAATHHLADLGVRLAIDDVGTGFSGLAQIVELSPDMLKIDRLLVRDVGQRPAKQAMISALTVFAARMGVEVVAEGIETPEELSAVRVLGVGYGQGYHLARPAYLNDVVPSLATVPAMASDIAAMSK